MALNTQQNNSVSVNIYVQRDSDKTKELILNLNKILSVLNKNNVFIKIIKVTSENSDFLLSKNITNVPALLYGNKKIIGISAIMNFLTSHIKQNTNKIPVSAEEHMHDYFSHIMSANDDEPASDDMSRNIKKRMEDFQKRRTQMVGVPESNKVPGGKPIKLNKKNQKKKFADNLTGDIEFLKASGVDQISDTTQPALSDDGDAMLEQYYLDEAKGAGKVVKKGKRR